ncbi:hypothetical protein [Neptunicella sp.]|uniref:hypothetical protein n=1 Tax=Neptunicella sp. TaxID=2125986 RepID=UPI003F692F76
MLINTVILFLRDVLPVFIVMSLLIAGNESLKLRHQWLILAVPLGVIGAFILVKYIGQISEWFDGAGMEVLLFSLHCSIYLLVLCYGYWRSVDKRNNTWLMMISTLLMCFVIWVSGANFLVFFLGYWSQVDAAQALVLGSILGLGINLSVAVLLFFAANGLMSRVSVSVQLLMLLIFAVGQLSQASHLLVQIDWLTQTAPLWDSSHLITDGSVTGYFLRSLVGYEAAPSFYQVSLYTAGLFLPIFSWCLMQVYRNKAGLMEGKK